MTTTDLAPLLAAFHAAVGCGAAVWTRGRAAAPPTLVAAVPRPPGTPEWAELPAGEAPRVLHLDAGAMLVARVAGPRVAWVGVGPLDGRGDADARRLLAL